jgi:hypothetical protein
MHKDPMCDAALAAAFALVLAIQRTPLSPFSSITRAPASPGVANGLMVAKNTAKSG